MNVADFIVSRQYFGESPPHTEYAYDANNRIEYIGWAQRGAATSEEKWFMIKFVYNGNGTVAQILAAPKYSIWDDREDTAKITFS
jgi:hypothetical protein